MNSNVMNSIVSVARFRTLALALSLVVVLTSAGAFGQAISGNLVGTVVDASGAAVTNAEVTALRVDTGIATTAKTNGTGEYRFDNLPVGAYKLTANSPGFKALAQQVDVVLNKTGTVSDDADAGGQERSKFPARSQPSIPPRHNLRATTRMFWRRTLAWPRAKIPVAEC